MAELAEHLAARYGVTVEGMVALDQDVYRVDGPGWVARWLPADTEQSATGTAELLRRLSSTSFAAERLAHPEPVSVEQAAPDEAKRGELVTELFDYDGGRQVTVYVPPSTPEAVVFAGDGQLISRWGGVLESADVSPTMIVGVHHKSDDDEKARLAEYSSGFDKERFQDHERFFIEDVRAWVRSRFGVALPAERTAVCGVSASAELALAMGVRHPDVFGAVLAASPGGGFRPSIETPGTLPRVYLVAGTLEPFFLENATRWAEALRDAGADVVLTERVGNHGDRFWAAEFPLMIAWAFGG